MEDVAIAPLDAAISSPLAGPDAGPQPGPLVVQRSPEQAEQLVLDLIAAHADSLLRTARRYSLCADDAQDAYQRGLEILMRHAGRLDADRAGGWLHTVVNHHNDTRRRRPARVRLEASDEGHRGIRFEPADPQSETGAAAFTRSSAARQVGHCRRSTTRGRSWLFAGGHRSRGIVGYQRALRKGSTCGNSRNRLNRA
jgi:hypothetical protein